MDLLERDDQLQMMDSALARATGGQGCVVAIAGEAGSGKTALVERFVADRAGAARVYRGACEHLSTPEPLLPLRDIARTSKQRFIFDPDADHLTSFESLLALLVQEHTVAVLVLEDVHWADAATLDLIRYLCRRVARVRALVLITYRDEELGTRSPLRDVLGEAPAGSVHRMVLEPLTLAAVKRLAERVGRSGDKLFALTGGNPFLVTEALAVDGDAPPDAVRDATLARAARLPAAGRTVLEVVSVFPRSVGMEMAAELIGGAMDEGLDACIGKGMLVLEAGTLRFRHEIARRAVENSLAPMQRRELHQRIVNALKKRPAARPSEMAHHAERAGDIAALVASARKAGDYAARTGAPREAAAHYAAMLRYHDALGADAAVEALECHAEQAYLMGAPGVAMASMEEAAQLRRSAQNRVRLGHDLTRLTRFAWLCGLRSQAEKYVAEAIAVLRAASAGPALAWAYSHQSQLDMLAFKSGSAIEWGERALELARRLGEQEIVIHALGNLGTARIELGGLGARADLERSLELAREGGHHDHMERAWCNLSCASYWRRDFRAALEYIDQGAAHAAERDLTHWEAYLRGWRAMILLDQGDWRATEREAQEICGWTSTAELYRFPALIALARLRVRRGDSDAEAPLAAARQLSATVDELQRSIYIAVVDAEIAWLRRIDEDAGSDAPLSRLRGIHELAVAQGVAWIAQDAALWLVRLGDPVDATVALSPLVQDHCAGRWGAAAKAWHDLGCPYEEAMALSEIGDGQHQALLIFDRLGAVPAAARLRRRMRTAGARSIPRGPITETLAHPAGLTRRQAQVLNLLGEQLSNAEIADRLCISAKTAEHHVGAVMARLNAGSRSEAAAAARKRGLLSLPER